MIIMGLLNLLMILLNALLTPIDIPDLPAGVAGALTWATTKLLQGLSIFAAFTHFSFLITLLKIVLIIDAAMLVYKFVRWILQKIPMTSVE